MQQIIDFIKGLMQPMFSVLAAFIVVRLLLTGFDQSLMFWLAAGVLGFWFGKTIGLFGDMKTSTTTNASTIEKLTETVNNLQEQSAIQAQDLATSTPAPVVNAILAKINQPTVTATTTTTSTPISVEPDIETAIKKAAAGALADAESGVK